MKQTLFVIGLLLIGAYWNSTKACSRVMYKGQNDIYMTARTMDWSGEMPTTIWVVPRGLSLNGFAGPQSLQWTSKYGSVIAEAFGGATDGMNEKGLMANMLWCRGTEFVDPKTTSRPLLSSGAWIQYLLDNYATVDEAVKGMQERKFDIVPMIIPGDNYSLAVHVSISDATGDNAIFEFMKGQLVVYHDANYKVMTNEPTYDKQLSFADYWDKIGGFASMPGTNKPEDRFVRASFYTNVIAPTDDIAQATLIAFSIIREVSVPIGIWTEDRPNVSTTIWRVVADHKSKIYYFEDAKALNSQIWIDLNKIDFSKEKGFQKLDMTKKYSGDVSDKLVESEYVIPVQSR